MHNTSGSAVPLQSAAGQRAARAFDPRFSTILAFVVGSLVLAIWLWSRICEFPSIPWNDIRIAVTVALSKGLTVYPTDTEGTINTWTYGPLPLLFFWPSAWASTPSAALMIAAALNMALTLVPIAVVCFAWPATNREADTRTARCVAFVLCAALWPERYYTMHLADNLAIACGLIGNVVLIRAKSPGQRWLAALVAVSSVACKQTALGIPLAQVCWVLISHGRAAAAVHALRCIVAGALVGTLAIASFGWAGLWFTLVELPAHFKWATDLFERLKFAGTELLFHVGAPLVLMIIARRRFARDPLLLPAITWLCVLPLGLSALFKFGGRMNSVHSLMLWLPPVVTVFLAECMPEARRRLCILGATVLMAIIACWRIIDTPQLSLRPRLSSYETAEQLAHKLRGQIWFPMHPLVTLYSEGRYYHDEDGWWVRKITHKAIKPEQAAAHLPPSLRAIAFQEQWTWGIAPTFLPPNAHRIKVGDWVILTPPRAAAPP